MQESEEIIELWNKLQNKLKAVKEHCRYYVNDGNRAAYWSDFCELPKGHEGDHMKFRGVVKFKKGFNLDDKRY